MSDLKFKTVAAIGSKVLATLLLSTRISRVGVGHFEDFRNAGNPVIFVFWHGQILPLVQIHRGEGIVVLVSEHDDGEYISRIIERNGFEPVRGSSTRGGIRGLKGLIRAARAGKDLALTPDGPRGPSKEFKPGALVAAQLTGLPLIPVAVGVSRAWKSGSWDGFLVPKPFSEIQVQYLRPRFVPIEASRKDLEELAREIGDQLRAASVRLDKIHREGSVT